MIQPAPDYGARDHAPAERAEGFMDEQARRLEEVLPRVMSALFTLQPPDPSSELPLAQLRVCTLLQAGPHSISALSRHMRCTASAVTQVADRLETAGLVERVTDACDRRSKCLQLTSRGAQMMHSRREIRTRKAREALERLTAEGRRNVLRALDSLLEACFSANGQPSGDHDESSLDRLEC